MKMTTLCYIENNDAYLMLHRTKKENDENADKWVGIGGKFMAGESPEDCIIREILEETGVAPISLSYRGIITFVSDQYGTEYMHLFHAKGFEGEIIRECPEGDLEWVPKHMITSLPLWQGDYLFLKLLDENIPFFSLKLRYEGEHLIEAVLNGNSLPISIN